MITGLFRKSEPVEGSHNEEEEEALRAKSVHPDVGLEHLFVPLKKECAAGCTERGNCNIEEGRCECPWGYGGPTCSEALMPACQLEPGGEPFFGMTVPRNCECVRQAHKFFGCSPAEETCVFRNLQREVRCYEFKDKPASEQWSRMPYENDTGVVWRRGRMVTGRELASLDTVAPQEAAVAIDLWWSVWLSLPLEECGETRCHKRGGCLLPLKAVNDLAGRQRQGSPPHCKCYKAFGGHTCGETHDEMCLNKCRGRGVCKNGFCHCRPPYFGLDCGRQYAWQLAPGASPVPNRAKLRIYVYELPSHIAFPISLDDGVWDVNEPSYHTNSMFLDLLLRDADVRTENPWEANLFYIPAMAYSYTSNTWPATNQFLRAVRYVQERFPFFNRTGGRDHFIWTTGDRGSCFLPRKLSPLIHITLFGMHASTRPGAPKTFLEAQPSLHPDYGCFHPKKDILAAPWYDHMAGSAEAPALYYKLQEDKGEDKERNLLFFFAGSVREGEHSYSGGARQALAKHLLALLGSDAGRADKTGNYSDIVFSTSNNMGAEYHKLYRRSKFCLAPHGHGFGVRLTLAMTHGCVPVIIQDKVWQPYESDGVLPYPEFSIRLGVADVPHIVPMLRGVSEQRLRAMRLAMVRYHRAFLWAPKLGGRAYEYTIRALEARLHGVWGELWPADTEQERAGDPKPSGGAAGAAGTG